jgi:signal transduction histidine kinase/ligand-binding sensor domain-containing protein
MRSPRRPDARSRSGAALFAVTLWAAEARALEPAVDDLHAHALPSVRQIWSHWYTIRGLAQGEDGYLWIATNDGLARFDGVSFAKLRLPAAQGPTDIAALAAGPAGLVVVALADGRLARVAPADPSSGLGAGLSLLGGGARAVEEPIAALAVDGERRIWLGTRSGLLAWDAIAAGAAPGPAPPAAKRMLAARVRGLVVAGDGRLRVASDAGLFRHGPAGLDRIGPARKVEAVAHDGAGVLWAAVAAPEPTLARVLPGGGEQALPRPERGPGAWTLAIAADPDGTVWMNASEEIVRIRADGVVRRRLAFSPPNLLRDREGSLWVGTMAGALARLGRPRVAMIGIGEGSGAAPALAVLAARDGSVWASSDEALFRFRGGAIERRYRRGDPPDFRCPRGLAEDAAGALWISGCNGLVYRHAGGAFTTFGAAEGLPREHFEGLTIDRAGTVWVGTTRGPLALRGGRFVAEPAEGVGRVRTLLGARDGALWVGLAGGGLVRVEAGRARRTGAAEGLAHGYVNALHESADGALWIGTRGGGIYRLAGGRLRRLDPRAGFPAENVHGFIEDGRGDLWVTSDIGAFVLPRGDLDAHLGGASARVRAIRYGREDGLLTERFFDGFSSPAARAADGRLWFPTALGVAVIAAPEAQVRAPLPRPLVEDVRLGSWLYYAGGAPSVEAEAQDGEVAFRFTAPSFLGPHRLRFQHRLEGHEGAWVDAREERVARYARLGPGTHTFRVRVAPDDAGGAGAETALALHVRRPARAWAYPALALALAGALAFAVQRARVRQVRRRFDAVLAERNRIARDLHDSLAQGFAGISYQVDHLDEAVAGGRPDARQAIERLRAMVRASRLEARQAIWNLRAEAADRRPLPERLRETAQQARLSSAASVDVEVDGDPRPLEPAVEQELARVAQEAITNALVHGHAREVSIALAYEPGAVRLAVRDDGAGFDASAAPAPETQHFGIAGMRERAARVGARLEIDSAPGAGTRVTVVVGRGASS